MSDFYVGYVPHASRSTAKFVRSTLMVLAALAVLMGALLVFAQQPFAESYFEFGSSREVQGVVRHLPYPALVRSRAEGGVSTYLLVGEGKRGAQVEVFDRRPVRVKGTILFRDGATAIEVTQVHAAGGLVPNEGDVRPLGRLTLRGEIVDSKCYFGVMNPGEGKVHRGCAARCISGGIPPVFVVRDRDGSRMTLLLTGGRGERVNSKVLDMVAEPLEITGEVFQRGDVLTIAAEPSTYRRIGE